MRRRVIPLRSLGWMPPEDPDDGPLLMLPPTPLDEMRELATALQARDASSVEAVLAPGRRHLQRVVVDELHRMVGMLVTEVALATTVRDKVGRGIANGAAFLAARPPDGVLASCSDATAVIERFDAACQALLTFLAAEVERTVEAAGGTPPADARVWVLDALDALRERLEHGDLDEVEWRTELAVWLVSGLNVRPPHGFRELDGAGVLDRGEL